MKAGIKRPQPALIVALIALIVALSGTTYGPFGKDSVGTQELKSKAVTRGKIGDRSTTGAQVVRHSLNAKNIDVRGTGTVPAAARASRPGGAHWQDGHVAGCPRQTTLINGFCFGDRPAGPVTGVKAAADHCAAAGGYLPAPHELLAAKGRLHFGNGLAGHSLFTDSYGFDAAGQPTTVVISSTGARVVVDELPKTHKIVARYEYICRYSLAR